jgi:putative transcriptional regulator
MKRTNTKATAKPRGTSQSAPAGLSPLARQLWQSLGEAGLHARGMLTLRTTVGPKPPPARSSASIARARRRAGMSQAVLARYLNVSPKTVQSWEHGARVPKAGEARLLQLFAADPVAFTDWIGRVGA